MMSHEEHHAPGEEEDGEDEEGDIEARTAVEALLALTSPTDYTHHTVYEDDFIMEPVPDDYSEKIVSRKEVVGVYNVDSVPAEMSLDDNCVRVIREPVSMHIENTSVRDTREMQVTVCTSEPSLPQQEFNVSETKEIASSALVPATNIHNTDDGLKQLKEFVKVTEGTKKEVITTLSENNDHNMYARGCSSVEKFHTYSQPIRREEKLPETFKEKSETAVALPVTKACEIANVKQCDTTLSPRVPKKETLLEANANVRSKMVCSGSRNKRGVQKLLTAGDIVQNFIKHQERLTNSSQTLEQTKGAINTGKEKLKGNAEESVEINRKQMDKLKESQSAGNVIKPKNGNNIDSKIVHAEVNSDGSDSENESDSSDSDGDSDTSSSSSDSDSSSSDSDSDGSDSDSDSETDSKSTGELEKKSENVEKQIEGVRKNGNVEKFGKLMNENLKCVGNLLNKNLGSSNKENISELKPSQTEEKSNGKKPDDIPVELKCKEVKPALNLKNEIPVKTEGSDKPKPTSVVEEKASSEPKNYKNSFDTYMERKESSDEKKCINATKVLNDVEKNITTKKTIDKEENNIENSENKNIKQSDMVSKADNVKKSCVQINKPNVSPTKNTQKVQRKTNLYKSSMEKMSEVDLVQQVAVAFAQQLTTIQANQLRGLSEKSLHQEEYSKDYKDDDMECLNQNSLDGEMAEEDKIDYEIDDAFPIPIQAEVVMSEGSESGIEYESYDRSAMENDDIGWCKKSHEILDQSEKENIELMAYLKSFVNGGGEGEVVEYPPFNNTVPSDGSDLTQWQLDGVHLPPFTPNVAPPSWLRLTIPAEGYRCHSCGDTFFIESSVVQHRERRSVWISLECGPCDAKLTFYNRCALKDHLRNHMMQGEEVDEETVEVRSLPLQLTRLLQPILVPVPKSLRVGNKKVRRNLKGHGAVNKLPVLKPIGRSAAKISEEYLNGSLEDHFGEDDSEEFAEYGDDDIRSRLNVHDKIPSGMKRLSTRKRTVRCYLCERMFHSVRELMAHMRTDQPYSDQRVECKKCQLVLPSVCAAKAHILTHPPANTSNMSVCPECGSRCDGPREFVHHLNTCGHQFRRSGIVCTECQVCFFKSQDDFLTHWIAEHCAKSYECVVCRNTFESLVFHKCTSPGQHVLATFRCLLTCPLCSLAVQLHAQEERDTNAKIKAHLADAHPSIITRVHYVYKSKFCTNAFRSKDELRAHHDREHRRDNHYRTKTCTLHHEVLGYQHQYFNGQEPRNAFVTLPVALSAEELHEARIRDVPTVSSVIDKTLFPDITTQESGKTGKVERHIKNKVANKSSPKEVDTKETSLKDSPAKKDMDQLDKLRPKVCYRCGYKYEDNKDFRRHKRTCEGESAERHCEICGMVAIGEDFARHCLGHIQDGAVLCIYCNGSQFNNSNDLEQHFELHVHEQFSYPATCAFCCTSLPDVPSALAHLNEEHDPLHVPFDTSEFECDRCGRRFHGERGLSVHLGRCTLGTATPTPSAGCRQCQVCTKALTPEMFGRHLVCHLEEGLLVCSLCDGRTLPSSMALLHHLEEHAAALAYPNSCPMCCFAMQDESSALIHLKEEHGFGNLHCAECDMHFNFTYQLQRHTDIVHKICQYAKRRYICWICRAYDHVKKETLMNHFRTVHGLDREQVDEKVMIRTRGQGTMPTSQFIPTKPLGSKENPGTSSASKSDSENVLFKSQKEKPKSSPDKTSTIESPSKQHSNKSSQSSSVKSSPVKSSPNKPFNSPNLKKVSTRKSDSKLKDKNKVLIKRLPDSILDEQSRSKRRKVLSNDEVKMDPDIEVKKEGKKRKRKKAYRCNICSFGTNYKDKLDNHILKHKQLGEETDSDGFVCRECGASFVVEPSLARHMFFAHKVKLQVSSADENEDNDKSVSEVKRKRTLVKEPKVIKEEKENEISTKELIVEKDVKEEKDSATIKDENDVVTKRKTARVTTKTKIEKETIKKQLDIRNKKKIEGIIRKKEAKGIAKKKVERVITKKKLEKLTPRKRMVKAASRRKAERDLLAKNIEEGLDDIYDHQCVVCKEEFINPVELYSHLRTHGMAFLKLGRKARPLGMAKSPD
ncbi:zinc finger protein 687a [Procambarus clarkii]|uniref:zinc finger protein 687a n=1 Tax=Procambarus clarkii TaxID=6728 RepID=UPI001E672EE7|nr:uncharacterized protein LOC123769857 [Procambarus clarkii]XP_045617199.1 uncharacterized protein LOC123769857 [Procambarus clarkii]XP_045617200.1 uncharacterized protein LOC123769857 [Procambarus clarkii]XP_045617201.1 uncharacterized protein LOC123769857 [Procambarus clarkii]